MIFLENDNRKLIDSIRLALKHSTEIKIAVAYIRSSGLNPIINDLRIHAEKGGSIKIITSGQMGLTEREAILSLIEIGAVVSMFTNSIRTFHPKTYIFKNNEKSTTILGSSNLTHSGLFEGMEWNPIG